MVHEGTPTAGNDRGGNCKVIMLHGRGATADSILSLSRQLPNAEYIAPQASGNTWYPHSFLEPREKNQPHLDSALERVDREVEDAAKEVSRERIVLLGFSQGACLAAEYAARNPEKYGGIICFSGGLIGEEPENYEGNLEDTPVFLGCSENDPHIPLERVEQTEQTFRKMEGSVEKKIYSGSSHTVNQDELEKASEIISEISE